jgi:arginine N-succinyltransferase
MSIQKPSSLLVRAARPDDVDELLALALKAGSGLTNLPPERDALAERLAHSADAIGAEGQGPVRPLMLVMEADGQVRGTAMVLPRVGHDWPFYSYKINRISQTSRAHKKSVAWRMLNLTNDFDGYAEVGGLLVDPVVRGVQAGRLMARSRYMFIAEHRDWFGDCVVSELRGVQDETGRSPFWEAVGRRFYDMGFEEADRLNGLEGNQFIGDLGPKYPIYVNLLPEDAQAVIGELHTDSRRAYALLIEEGFRDEDYVDIFDAGPTIHTGIDELKAVRDCRRAPVVAIVEDLPEGVDSLVSSGHAGAFTSGRGRLSAGSDGLTIERRLAELMQLKPGDRLRHVAF